MLGCPNIPQLGTLYIDHPGPTVPLSTVLTTSTRETLSKSQRFTEWYFTNLGKLPLYWSKGSAPHNDGKLQLKWEIRTLWQREIPSLHRRPCAHTATIRGQYGATRGIRGYYGELQGEPRLIWTRVKLTNYTQSVHSATAPNGISVSTWSFVDPIFLLLVTLLHGYSHPSSFCSTGNSLNLTILFTQHLM